MLQPCACQMHEADWPYDHDDVDPVVANGLNCGVDENGDQLLWVEPTDDVGGFAASKSLASGIAATGWVAIPGPYDEHFGAGRFTSGTFTAIRAGIYAVTFQLEGSDDAVAADAFEVYARVSTNYAPWDWTGDPLYVKDHDSSVAIFGGGANATGDLPCNEGGELTYEVYHTKDPTAEFKNIYCSAFWKSPIPT